MSEIKMEPFSLSALERIAKIIGDRYTGSEITEYFRKAGFQQNRHDGTTKWRFVYSALEQIQSTPNGPYHIAKLIQQLCDPQEYFGNAEGHRKIVNEVNEILNFYELAVNHSSLYESDLGTFVNYLGILNSLGIEIEAARIEEKGVRLMTLHATKGLEYKTVILTNLAQKRFPMEKIITSSLIPLCLMPEFKDKEMSKEDLDYYMYEYERKHQIFLLCLKIFF